MKNTRLEFQILKHYLQQRGFDCRGVSVAHDVQCDLKNLEDPRSFCFVLPKSKHKKIHCSYALEYLSESARVGVLLHECIHLIPVVDEVDCDLYIAQYLPEANYRYKDCTYYVPSPGGKVTQRRAKALQSVSHEFLNLIGVH